MQKFLNVDDVVGIVAKPTVTSATALCGAFKSGATVALLDPDKVDHTPQFFMKNRVRLLVALKGSLFSSRYLQGYFQPGEQVMTLDNTGRVIKTKAFSHITKKTSPADWVRPELNDQQQGSILRINAAGDVYHTSRQELLEQVEKLYCQSQSCSDKPEVAKVEGFLHLLVQLLRGKRLSC